MCATLFSPFSFRYVYVLKTLGIDNNGETLGNPRVDVLGIDVEGADLQVLQTIPFDKVDITLIMVEMAHLGEIFPGDNDYLRRFLHDQGYVFYRRMSIDDIYIKESFLNTLQHIF